MIKNNETGAQVINQINFDYHVLSILGSQNSFLNHWVLVRDARTLSLLNVFTGALFKVRDNLPLTVPTANNCYSNLMCLVEKEATVQISTLVHFEDQSKIAFAIVGKEVMFDQLTQ